MPASTAPTGTIFTAVFWRDTAERTIRTFAQALAAALGADAIGLLDADLAQATSVAGLAALIALLWCVASGAVDAETGASMGTTTPGRATTTPALPAETDGPHPPQATQ